MKNVIWLIMILAVSSFAADSIPVSAEAALKQAKDIALIVFRGLLLIAVVREGINYIGGNSEAVKNALGYLIIGIFVNKAEQFIAWLAPGSI